MPLHVCTDNLQPLGYNLEPLDPDVDGDTPLGGWQCRICRRCFDPDDPYVPRPPGHESTRLSASQRRIAGAVMTIGLTAVAGTLATPLVAAAVLSGWLPDQATLIVACLPVVYLTRLANQYLHRRWDGMADWSEHTLTRLHLAVPPHEQHPTRGGRQGDAQLVSDDPVGDLLAQVDYLIDVCEGNRHHAAERSSPAFLYELVVDLADVVRQQQAALVGEGQR